VNVIVRLIGFIFNDAEWLGKRQLKHCTLRMKEKKGREDVPVGIVGCRQYSCYIYTECIGNNSRTEGECGDGAHVLMNRIENVAVRRRQQEGWLERTLSTVANRCKICSLPTTLFQLQTIHNTVGRLS
jgi:uncharacterized LabA/DUF88 family protein